MEEKKKRSRAEIGKASREKGARGERDLANLLRDEYNFDTRRGSVFRRESDIVGLSGVHVEVKVYGKTLNLYGALKQAEKEALKRGDGVPTVFHKKDYKGWLVTMNLSDWINLYVGRAYGGWVT